MTGGGFDALPSHGRFGYEPIRGRPDFRWPGGTRLAVYIAMNLEHFAFGEGLGAGIAPPSPMAEPDVLNHAWREYGNRVGAWRCLEVLDDLSLPCAALVNTALYDHAPDLIDAFAARGDEMVAHGHSNASRQGALDEADERALIRHCRERMTKAHGIAPRGWLSPWISESRITSDLLREEGFDYTLNWCHDEQPTRLATRAGPLWAVPYPQELNDIPMIIARQLDAKDFAQMIVDQFDELIERTQRPSDPQSLVMGLALHPYIVGQPYRLRHLRRALQHIVAGVGEGVWLTQPGAIVDAMAVVAPPPSARGLL